jgi:hypothetical protein
VNTLDSLYRDAICVWCFNPRSSPECNYTQNHEVTP